MRRGDPRERGVTERNREEKKRKERDAAGRGGGEKQERCGVSELER